MIVVAGHVCLDIIPNFVSSARLEPGTLVRVGQARLATGGVSNVGVALHRLGFAVRLIHRVGQDFFGNAIRSLLNDLSPELITGIRTVVGETSSYSVVIAPPGVDRMFIHCPGANDTFTADDISPEALHGGRHLHFGYPPIMRAIYTNPGQARTILDRARQSGMTTSMDLCSVDPESEAGRVHWEDWFKKVLPAVDLFTPSFDELSRMLGLPSDLTESNIITLAEQCLSWNCRSVLIKLGDQGLFYADADQILHQSCRKVNVVTTNGSGDCTIAGFLASWTRSDPIRRAMDLATAVGACCCEAADATSGVPKMSDIESRIADGWEVLRSRLDFNGENS